jgi:hypothetical protein
VVRRGFSRCGTDGRCEQISWSPASPVTAIDSKNAAQIIAAMGAHLPVRAVAASLSRFTSRPPFSTVAFAVTIAFSAAISP